MIEFIKSLFKKSPPPAPEYKKYNVGKTTGTIKLKKPFNDKDVYQFTWTGAVLEDWAWDGRGIRYLDKVIDSNVRFTAWLKRLDKFIKVDDGVYLPLEDIESITSERIDHCVEVEIRE